MAFRRFRSIRPVPKGIRSPFGRGRPTIVDNTGNLQLRYVWNGRKILDAAAGGTTVALNRAADDAREYWNTVAWNEALHPYMTGDTRNAGRFDVVPASGDSTGRLRARLIGHLEPTEEYMIVHEFGSERYQGHFPMRMTLDFIAPRIRVHLQTEMGGATRQVT